MPMLDPKVMGDYARYSQLGLEMVAPIVLGYLLDDFVFNTLPWLTIVGAVIGLVWMLYRINQLVERENRPRPPAAPKL